MTGGIGAGGGYDSVDDGPDMLHETIQLKMDWRVTDKLSANLHGGGEDRQFIHSNEGNLITPTYGASIVYSPLDFTSVTLALDRSVSPAITTGSQASDVTSLSVTLNQRLLKRLQFSVSGAYSTTTYVDAVQQAGSNRTDTYYSLNTRLTFTLLKRFDLSGTYQYSENMSSDTGLGFASSQIGLDISYRF